MAKCYLLCCVGVDGNHSRVKRHRISSSPSDKTAAFPFASFVRQHVLSRVVDIVTEVTGITTVQLDHIFSEDFVSRETQQTFHTRVDVAYIKVTVGDCHQFYEQDICH